MGSITIKFNGEMPTNEEVKVMADTWECFKTPDLVIKTLPSKKAMLIDFCDFRLEVSRRFSELYSKYPDAWISGYCTDDGDVFKTYLSEYDGKNKVDYTRFNGWGEYSVKKERKVAWNIMKSVGFDLDYIRFALLGFDEKHFETVVDYCVTEEYINKVINGEL